MKQKINFKLLLITDRKSSKENFFSVIKKAMNSGIKAVQLREKDLTSKELLLFAKKIRIIASHNKVKLVINDRADIALLSNADGVHSPAVGLNANQIKSVCNKFICGKSVHSIRQAVEAERNGFDYVLFGPIFRTPSKVKFGKPKGLNELNKVCTKISIPVIAVGGINPERAKKCLNAGAYGVAVIREIMLSVNLKKTIRGFENSLGSL